jgi:Tfp pilus assembly pilus retraction ATPase PilT
MTLADLLIAACEQSASDLVLVGKAAPVAWIRGQAQTLGGLDTPLAIGQVERMFRPLLSIPQQEQIRQAGDLDWSAGVCETVEKLQVPAGVATGPLGGAVVAERAASPQCLAGRMRMNLHRQRGDWAAAIRFIPRRIPPLASLGLPPLVADWISRPRGLVLVTGPTGSGKSTTLAALIDRANEVHDYHVITLEDPIEYEFEHGGCLIEQRQIGQDCPTFADALRHVVRQRPDVIMVGELRDRETIAAALTAAETGHLVLGTLHTNSAPGTVERIIDVFEPGRQNQIRVQLAGTLECILCQNLLPDRAGGGLVPATEVLLATTAVRRAIRDGQTGTGPRPAARGRADQPGRCPDADERPGQA